jgi:hypothetical protein
MKTRNITLAIAGLVIIAAGCAIRDQAGRNPTGYVVTFGSSSAPMVKVKEGFNAALQKAQARKGIVFKPPQIGVPPDFGAWVSLSTDSLIPISQGPHINPLGLNVTQHVRFNFGQEKDLLDLLAKIDYGTH